jgi:beta-galactosidase/beta-glucuronidase
LRRKGWVDLCGRWGFAYDDADRGLAEGWPERAEVFDREIVVPFPPESRASGIGAGGFHPVVWYRRAFQAPSLATDQRLLLHFGAIDYRATVWVNGRLVAEHEGGQTPFQADITGALGAGEDGMHTVVVRAEDRPDDLTQPRGKQDWRLVPHRIWYSRTTGIWQPVWLETVPAVHIAELRWTPDLDRGLLGLAVRLSRRPEGRLRLRLRLSLRGRPLLDDTYTIEGLELHRAVAIEPAGIAVERDDLLWQPRYPNLLDAELTLWDGSESVDHIESYVGLRSCGVADGRFMLNGRPFYPRLVLAQNFWPESHLAAPSPEALRREAELIKALGFNGVRIHQKVEDPRFLAHCDRLGLLVWGEMANAYVYSLEAVARLTREWMEVVRRDYSHPCIVTWMPLNESWGVPNLERDPAQRAYVRALYNLTKALDPTRPVIGNDGWEHVASDILGIHDYVHDAALLRERYGSAEALERTLQELRPYYRRIALADLQRVDEPVMLTEFGGINHSADPAGPRWGYGETTDKATYLAHYAALVDAVLDSPVIAGFCYTQLTDTEQETNGLLTADREPKLDPEAVRAINSRPSRAVPGDIVKDAQIKTEVTAFSGPTG